ncbi:uncharacterized protein C19orf44 homolog isoform X1 [Salvelinus sp. IW2-2015]|uniref:uncharacterized protein C19orf44 homolog isoform X1 n=1 Tax=Salvelinus sp. IW2-2015 TaxID=2691554 RepID=UPI000CDFB3DA|nr:uncharacterized protein C19orf44 homolog isoform X1 [Salvelinus alpinus]XP_023826923.1 uncharacterized protein C19orf44 homolog isoform X1 [Salvelinus alpinus]
MWNRGGRSSALERAQAQLSERRITKNTADSKDNPERYVAKGTVKTHGDPGYVDTIANRRNTSQARQTPFQDLSDLSLSLEDDPPPESVGAGWGSRFLKKAPPPATSQPPALSRTQTQPVEPKYVTTSHRSSQSTALSRLALIENRIRNRQQARDGPALSNRSTPPAPQEREMPLTLSDQSSSGLSMKGKRFLKKTANASPIPVVVPKEKGPDLDLMPLGGFKAPTPPVRVASRGVTLDSDEEDMRKLLGGSFESSEDSLHKEARVSSQTTRKSFVKRSQKVSPSPPLADWPSSVRALSRSPPFPQRLGSPNCFSSRALAQHSPSLSIRSASVVLSPSPSPPNTPSPGRQGSPRARHLKRSRSSLSALSEVRSLEELFPEALGSLMELYPEDLPSDDAISEKSGVSDEFKLNIMSLDDLAPVITLGMSENKKNKKKETKAVKHKDPAPRSFIEEVSGEEQIPSEEPREDYESDFESEIRTETDRSRMSEISEHLGDGDKGVSEVRNYIVSDTSRQDKYSSVSEGDSHVTHTDYSRTADSFSGRSSKGSYSRSSSHSHSVADTITPSSVWKRRSPSRRSVREAAVQTQADGLAYTWSSVCVGMAALGPAVGMAYVDPTPVASHTVSAEAVEALSAYSPAVFALNDILRQQLALTKHFVQTSRHLHSSLLQSLGPADYTYTTLEDTKEFIRCHKSPQLTMEEALEEVLQEMREYHYI